ncbi:MAG: hypothetical protein LBJ67_04035 [Planctomycetaceae bacterium]|nr:hypothetical protein [Planctomycetaceae bacterium]
MTPNCAIEYNKRLKIKEENRFTPFEKDFIIKSYLQTLWRNIKGLLFIGITVLVVVAVYAYRNMDSQLRRYVQNQLSAMLPLTSCEVQSAQLVSSKGIVLRGIRIAAPDEFGNKQTVVEIQEAFIACQVDLQTLLREHIKLEKIILRKAVFNLTLDKTGQLFALDKISNFHSSGKASCPVEILDSDIIFSDMRKPENTPLLFAGWNFQATPSDSSENYWLITGKLSHAKVKEMAFEAKFVPKTKNLSLTGHATQFLIDQEYLSYFPKLALSGKTPEALQAKANFEFQAEYDKQKYAALAFQTAFHVRGEVYDGNILFPLAVIRHAISDVHLRFDATHDSLSITDLSAVSGESRLQGQWQQSGFAPLRLAKLGIQVTDFRFDKKFLPTLMPYLPDKFHPAANDLETEGVASLDAVVTFDGTRWAMNNASCKLSHFAVTHAKFPYLLDYLDGTIVVEPKETVAENGQRTMRETLTLQLASATQKIHLRGEMLQIPSAPIGRLEITGENIPINEKLLAAMTHEQRKIVNSLHADGNFDAKLDIVFPGERQPIVYTLQLAPRNCSMRYEKFPLQLKNICGIFSMQNGNWTFQNLRAENNAAILMGNGLLVPDGESGCLALDVSVRALELNKELTSAFENKSQRELISNLNMAGEVDVALKIQYLIASEQLNIEFDAETNPKVTTIKPAVFPFPLEKVTCRVQYRNGNVEVRNFRGRKGNSSLCADIDCFFRPDGSWVMSLDNILADRVEHDAELIRALPPDLQTFVTQMQLTDPITLRGSLCFQKEAAADPADSPLCSYWNLGVVCHQNSANFGVALTNICGKINLIGKNDGTQNTLCGELELDSVNYGDYQLTNLRGPFSFNDNRITLGHGSLAYLIPDRRYPHQPVGLSVPAANKTDVVQAAFAQSATVQDMTENFTSPAVQEPLLLSLMFSPDRVTERRITAQLYGGNILLSGYIFLQQGVSYRLQSQLDNVNLETMTQETFADNPFRGKLSGRVMLEGGKSRESIKGEGNLSLREADIYKLPTMQNIMKLLRVRSPDDEQSMINSSDIAFSVHGNDVTLSDVKMDGSLFGLSGSGEMNLETTAVTLRLGTRLGGNKSRASLFGSMFNTSMDPISPMLTVEGTLKGGDLSVHNQALSNVRSMLNSQQDSQQPKRPVRDFLKNAIPLK